MMKKFPMHWQILIALLASSLTAMLFRSLLGDVPEGSGAARFVSETVKVLTLVGDLFITLLKMVIVPLIVSAVISAISSLGGMEGFGRLGLKTLGFYALSTILAAAVGLMMVNTLQPGLVDGQPNAEIRAAFEQTNEGADDAFLERFDAEVVDGAQEWTDIFYRLVPENIFWAASDNGQMLGLLAFSLLFAIVMTRLPAGQMKPLQQTIQGINDVMLRMTQWIMKLAPFGIYGLIFPVVFKAGPEVFAQLAAYFVTVIVVLAVHVLITLPVLLKLLARVNPLRHFKAMRVALLTAFSTASSSATLPETMYCVEKKAGVSKRTSSFTIPFGATVNMDGTALYECVAVVFVAQVMGMNLGFGEQVLIVFAALLTSVGVAGIPSASLVAILLILQNTNVPNAEIAMAALFAVDRPLDMMRTAVNVFGDSCAAVVIGKSEGESGILEG